MKYKFTILILLAAIALRAGTSISYADEPDIKYATELDILPYITGGYYLSSVICYGDCRFRAIVSEVNVPKFATASGYENYNLQVAAVIADYFFEKDYKGPWIGAGLELWKNKLTESSSGSRMNFNTSVATCGAGWVVPLAGGLFINPWAAFHLKIGGDKNPVFPGGTYKPKTFTPEASLKIGFMF